MSIKRNRLNIIFGACDRDCWVADNPAHADLVILMNGERRHILQGDEGVEFLRQHRLITHHACGVRYSGEAADLIKKAGGSDEAAQALFDSYF